MTVKFIHTTPYTKRKGSQKLFEAGREYVLDNEYAKELIQAGACVPVKTVGVNELVKRNVQPEAIEAAKRQTRKRSKQQ